MKNPRRIGSILVLLALSVVSVCSQTQRPPNRTSDRQIDVLLQQLEITTRKFRNSLNSSLIESTVDQTIPANDINTFEPGFEEATYQLRSQVSRRIARKADVENVLQQASLINGFMARNRLNRGVQNDWVSVKTSLNGLANAYGISWQWNRPLSPTATSNGSQLADVELNKLIQRLETGGDRFGTSLTEAFGQSRYDRTSGERNMNDAVRGLKNDTEQLRNQFDNRQPLANSVAQVLTRVTPIDTFMRGNLLTNRAQNDWSTLRGDLNTLAQAYNHSASWNSAAPARTEYNSDSSLTGTFKLDASRSDNARESAIQATQNLPRNQRQGISDRLLARLASPEMLAIQRRGLNVTLASSIAPRSTFEADGTEHLEQLSNGQSSRVTATLRNDQLSVSSTGYKASDFNVTFKSIENGQRLLVKREIYSERLSQPIIVNSVYDRISEMASWSVYGGSEPYLKTTSDSMREFILQDGEDVVAVLNIDLTTSRAKQGDPFTMTVRQPGKYEGAVISGTVGSVEQSGRLIGRSGMTLNFDSIQLSNGQTYRFAGTLASVRLANGDIVKVDNEGSAQGDNQTTQTATRAGVGTVVGAIIGAIAGGGKGAAIGGIIGAAGGAGSVYVQGKDDLQLPSGTEVTIRAAATR